ncbi:Rieske (2Fe-2S) protein [Halobellus limi]|uniref:Ferredoxin subunit of nitrite reductase or a ring-hydroxylating dioxygenase n=1 Tax=Halobellus limi TaxID=699433 RepID=A0A1H6C388_9EURY|nr:Rieske 2Fe-2S domain-containing protein [Halobellus limi]QCC48581.1 Rieske (2Fe-2S) protein [Halobellus limi]SEG67434.1 Ferredoxin subunit of nitrite reductase or a ring-hydroxylating dioxygenase [Halobellus limi]
MDEDRRIVAAEEVTAGETVVFTAKDGFEKTEGLLTRLDDGTVVAFTNYCPHWRDVRLDKGSSALVRNGEIVCQKHGATFEKSSGHCDFGPCEGAVLDTFEVTVDDGAVYLTGDEWDAAEPGLSEERDLSSGGRIDF